MNPNLDTIIKGSDFNEIYKGKVFYKFLQDDMTEQKHQYNSGLNKCTEQYYPDDEIIDGVNGKNYLHFCEENSCHMFIGLNHKYIAKIIIPDNALIYINSINFRTNMFIIDKIIDISDLPFDFLSNMVVNSGHVLSCIRNLSNDICIFAVNHHPYNLCYIDDPTKEVIMIAINKCPSLLTRIKIVDDGLRHMLLNDVVFSPYMINHVIN